MRVGGSVRLDLDIRLAALATRNHQGLTAMTLKPDTTVRMGLIRKKESWTTEAFRTYWRDHHGALAGSIPNLREYWQNPVIDRLQRGIDFARGPWDFDGFSQLWFDDAKEADVAF